MAQNRKTGAEASKWGHDAATLIANQIGANRLSVIANDFEWKGLKVTLHSAAEGNSSVGVTYKTLSRIQLIVGAFEVAPGKFDLWSITPDACKDALRDSPTGKGKVALLTKGTFTEFGKFEQKVFLPVGPIQTELVTTLELLEFRAPEGKMRLVAHSKRERRADLTLAKRNEIRAKNGCLICEACGSTEKDFPDSIGEACFEVHHKAPLSEVADETETRLADLAMLCANCHRMIHRSEPMPTVEAFKTILAASRRAN